MKEKKALVLGRALFVDLWCILGYEPVVCESIERLRSFLAELKGKEDVACIMVEEEWLNNLPLPLREKIEKMNSPRWIPFPSLSVEE